MAHRDGSSDALSEEPPPHPERHPSDAPSADVQVRRTRCGSDAWDDARLGGRPDAARPTALPQLHHPAAGEDAGTKADHELAGRQGDRWPRGSPDAPAAAAAPDKQGADRSEARSYGVPAGRVVRDEGHEFRLGRAHAAPRVRLHDGAEPCRAVPPPDESPAADETKLPDLPA